MDELLKMLGDAVVSQNWMVVAVVAVLVVLSVVVMILKLLKKEVPLLDTLLSFGKSLVKVLPAKPAPAPVDPAKDGVANVVPIKDETQK